MSRCWFWGATALLVSCGAESDGETGSTDCEARRGTYSATYEERDGTCGPIPEQIITADEETVLPDECEGRIRNSADLCEVTIVDLTCPEPGLGEGYVSVMGGKYEWASDGKRGTGVLSLKVLDEVDGIVCQSTYNVRMAQL